MEQPGAVGVGDDLRAARVDGLTAEELLAVGAHRLGDGDRVVGRGERLLLLGMRGLVLARPAVRTPALVAGAVRGEVVADAPRVVPDGLGGGVAEPVRARLLPAAQGRLAV